MTVRILTAFGQKTNDMGHTKGKLSVIDGFTIVSENMYGVADCTPHYDSDGDGPIQLANARRIVAAWNACEGIETEDLEDMDVRELLQKNAGMDEVWIAQHAVEGRLRAEIKELKNRISSMNLVSKLMEKIEPDVLLAIENERLFAENAELLRMLDTSQPVGELSQNVLENIAARAENERLMAEIDDLLIWICDLVVDSGDITPASILEKYPAIAALKTPEINNPHP